MKTDRNLHTLLKLYLLLCYHLITTKMGTHSAHSTPPSNYLVEYVVVVLREDDWRLVFQLTDLTVLT